MIYFGALTPPLFLFGNFFILLAHIDFDFFCTSCRWWQNGMEKRKRQSIFFVDCHLENLLKHPHESTQKQRHASDSPLIRKVIYICWWQGREEVDICDCEFEHKTNWKIIRATQIVVFPPIDNDSTVNVNRSVSMSLQRCWMFTSGWMKRRGKRSLAKEPIHPPQYRQGLLAIENRSKRLGSLFVKAILWSRPSPHPHHTPPAIGYKSFNWSSGDGYQMSRNRVNWCCRPLSPVNQMSSEIM